MIDLQSHTWAQVVRKTKERREKLSKQLEQIGLPTPQTEALRGQLQGCDWVLKLPDEIAREEASKRT